MISEEPLDAVLYRPLARGVAAVALPLGMTANHVTLLASIVGIFAGVAAGFGARPWPWIAAGALAAFMVLDCADGEVARRRGGGSRLGQVLDGISDYLVSISAHVGFLVLAWNTPAFAEVPRWALFAVVLASGISKAVHSALFDAAKTKFRRGMGKSSQGLESEQSLREELARAVSWRDKLILRLYIPYTAAQRRATAADEAPPSQAEFLGWTMLGPTLRLTAIMIPVALYPIEPRALLAYPAFGLVAANAWLAVMMVWRRSATLRPATP